LARDRLRAVTEDGKASPGALDDLRAKGHPITVYCSFVADFIKKHTEYADLIDPAHPGSPRHV